MSSMSYPTVSVDPEQEHFISCYPIIGGMKNTTSSLSDDQEGATDLQLCQERIAFIIYQIESLEHYLPETYQMLMDELDQQHVKLKNLEILDFYRRQHNAEQDKTTNPRNQAQGQEPTDCPA